MPKKTKADIRDHFEDINFKKYAIFSRNDIKGIERQWYISQKMKEKGVDSTEIKTLLNFIISDIDKQYAMKQDIENKAGILIALLGVMTTIFFQKGFLEALYPKASIVCMGDFIKILLLIGLTYLFCYSIIRFIEIFENSNFSKVEFSEKERFFRCAVDDKELCLTILLECFTNVWMENEKKLMKKSNTLKECAKSVFAFTSSILTTYYITLFLEVRI